MDLLQPPKEPSEHDEEREIYGVLAEACYILEDEGIPFVVGGGVALRAYGRARPLKDTDIFLPLRHVFRAMDALTRRGGFHTRDTDGAWLYKAIKNGNLVDLIVRNMGTLEVDEDTMARARIIDVYGHRIPVMGPEDLLIRKILAHVEGRPHLFDAMSMLSTPIEGFDWDYFVDLSHKSNLSKALSGLLYMEGEFGHPVAPDGVMCQLIGPILNSKCPTDQAG